MISAHFDGILLDAYGVFWAGNDLGPFPGSLEAMANLVASGKVVGILSNSTQPAEKEIRKLLTHGIEQGKHFHFMVTSGEVAKDAFFHKKIPVESRYWLFCGGHPKYGTHQSILGSGDYVEMQTVDEADFVYIAVPHIAGVDQTNPELFRAELEAIKTKNLPMVCANPDEFALEGNPPRPVVRQGTIARMYKEMGGTVHYIGKPHPMAYAFAMEKFREYNIKNPEQILMVGDTPETDIRGAAGFGMKSCLLTETGIMAERISTNPKAIDHLSPEETPTYLRGKLSDGL